MAHRDTQRRRLYDAEQTVWRRLELAAAGGRTLALHNSTLTVPIELRFGDLDGAQRYVDGLRHRAWFRARFPRAAAAPLRLRRRRGGGAAHYQPPGVMAVHEPPRGRAWALRELVVLHELAHHAVHHDVDAAAPAHGPRYAGVLHHLVERAVGPEVALLLACAYADAGVRWRPPTPEDG